MVFLARNLAIILAGISALIVWSYSVYMAQYCFNSDFDSIKLSADWARSAVNWLFFGFLFAFVLSFVLCDRPLTVLLWTFCLAGFAMGIIFSFAVLYTNDGINEFASTNIEDYIYFSVVTFTTLGYGDLQPAQDTRLLAAFQAFLGFTFVPVIISEIVNLSTHFRRI